MSPSYFKLQSRPLFFQTWNLHNICNTNSVYFCLLHLKISRFLFIKSNGSNTYFLWNFFYEFISVINSLNYYRETNSKKKCRDRIFFWSANRYNFRLNILNFKADFKCPVRNLNKPLFSVPKKTFKKSCYLTVQ